MNNTIHFPATWDVREVLRALFSSLPIGVCITDETACFVFVNEAYAQLYGYAVDELIGQSFLKVVPPEHQAVLQELHDRFLSDGAREEDEQPGVWEVVRSDGQLLTIRATARRFTSQDGKRYKVTTVTDITQQRRLEKLRHDAERVVRHDLRSPLNGIIGGAEMLFDDPQANEIQRDLAAIILEGGQQMLHLLNHSMDFFCMEEGTYRVAAKPFFVADLFVRLNHEFSPFRHRRNQRLLFTVHGQPLETAAPALMYAERPLIHNMLANLVKNALEAADETDQVEVNYALDAATGHCFTIKNPGLVPSDIRDNVFDRYVSKKQGGTGLGTYSAQLIARAHGGGISFQCFDEEDCTIFSANIPMRA